jgi:nucleotide-binding universal stress UspA family protein
LVNLRQAFRHAPTEPSNRVRRLLVYVTGTPADQRVLEVVEKIAERPNTEVTIAYVVEVQQSMPLDAELPAEIEYGEHVLHEAEEFTARCVNKRAMLHTELLQARSAGAAIVDEAVESNATAIVMACSLKKKMGRVTIGETVDYVLRNAPCEVIVVRQRMSGWDPDGM